MTSLMFVQRDRGALLEGPTDACLMHSVEDVTAIIEQCLSHRTLRVLLYASNLTDRFFDLSSGEAGAILQKLFQYRNRVAIVYPPGAAQPSTRFGDMMAEETGLGRLALFDSAEAARTWLTTP